MVYSSLSPTSACSGGRSGWWCQEDSERVPCLWPGREYLLGDFGVQVYGRHASITSPVRSLAFGDWTRQGLAFYGGSVTYQVALQVPEVGEYALHIPHFAAPLLDLVTDGHPPAPLAFAPYTQEVGLLAPGTHTAEIIAYGNRVNTFGNVHHPPERPIWYGPNAWRTQGDDWTDEYQLRPQGILSAPHILTPE